MQIGSTISPITPSLTHIAIARVNGAFGSMAQMRESLAPYLNEGLITFVDIPNGRTKPRTNNYSDKALVEFVKETWISHIALSYVNSPDDLIYDHKTIAKIETADGYKNIKPIARKADMVLIDRRDLATAIGVENVPHAVRSIITASHAVDTPVIVASELLLSMVSSPEPTLAEASDIARCAELGADYVLLAEETAIGRHPQQAIDFVRKLVTDSYAPISRT
jgi:pyruvate kinase